jgi:hypothetical protein
MRGLVLAACLAMLTTAATPADAPAAPAPTPAAPTLAATVRSVTGTVEWRPSPPCHHDEYLNGKGTIGP